MKSRAGVLLAVWVACASMALPQQDTRGIVPEDLFLVRPKPHTKASPAKPAYQAVDGQKGAAFEQSAAGRQLGIIIWRLRLAEVGETGARILVHEENNTLSYIPERVASTASLSAGDRVRLSVESPAPGYLYVIDRERYSSGELSAPYLIFPTTRTRNGDNKLFSGKLIDIPAQEDQPNFFRLHKGRRDQVTEELTLMLTPERLDGLTIGLEPLCLTDEQVSNWERQWGKAKIRTFELNGGAGKAWTQAEQQAASDGTRLLTQEDPLPQTVYRVAAGASDPLMVKVRLKYR